MPLPYLPIECPAEVRHRGYQRKMHQIVAHERFPLLLQRVLELKSQMRGVPLSVDTAVLLGSTEQLRRKHGVQYIIPTGEDSALDLFIERSCNEFLAMLRDIHNAHAITTHAFELVQHHMVAGTIGGTVVRGVQPQQPQHQQHQQHQPQHHPGKRVICDTIAFANHKRRITSTLSQFVDSSYQAGSDATEADDSNSSAPSHAPPAAVAAAKPAQSRSKAKFDPWQQDILLRWLIDHEDHPYPKPKDKEELAEKTQLTPVQIQNWFTNMRKRHWLPIINGKKKPRSYLDMHLYLRHNQKKQQGSADTAADPQSTGTTSGSSSTSTSTSSSASGSASRDEHAASSRSLRSRSHPPAPTPDVAAFPQPHPLPQAQQQAMAYASYAPQHHPHHQPAALQQMPHPFPPHPAFPPGSFSTDPALASQFRPQR